MCEWLFSSSWICKLISGLLNIFVVFFYKYADSSMAGNKMIDTSPGCLVCWSLTSLCHSNGHIETMPAREINPFTALTRIRSQFLRTQWSTSNHQRVDTTMLQTAQPSGLAYLQDVANPLLRNNDNETMIIFCDLFLTSTIHMFSNFHQFTIIWQYQNIF